MRDMAIVFMHHETDKGITAEHLELIKKNNPDELIITVSQHPKSEKFPGGYALAKMTTLNNLWNNITWCGTKFDRAWYSSDIAICSWFAGRRPEHRAHRWIFTEWDVRCIDTSFREFWKPVWNEHVASISTHTRLEQPKWLWYEHCGQLVPEKFKPHMAGMFGFCGIMLSDQAFQDLTNLMSTDWFECFSELRFATFARYLGYKPVGIGQMNLMTGNIAPSTEYLTQDITTKGIWHPVKGY